MPFYVHCLLIFSRISPHQRPPLPSSGKRRICRLHENSAITVSVRQTDSPQKPAQSKPTHKWENSRNDSILEWRLYDRCVTLCHVLTCAAPDCSRKRKYFLSLGSGSVHGVRVNLCILEKCHVMKMLKSRLWPKKKKTLYWINRKIF